jgi:hypothetical protein
MKIKVNHYIFILIGIIVVAGAFMFIKNNKKEAKSAYIEEVVMTPTGFMKLSQSDDVDMSSWETFTNEKLKFTMKHPANVVIDERQTSEGRITAFIFEKDVEQSLPGKVTALYIADTGKKGVDGFSAFRKGDCGKECKVSYKNVTWININNVYGVKNPMPGDVANYFLTDKNQSSNVINFYVGGYIKKEKGVQEKIDTFEQMIKTVEFEK